jgi:hypothetical protein
LALKRFADDYVVALRSLAGGSAARIAIPADAASQAWTLRATHAASQEVTVCNG